MTKDENTKRFQTGDRPQASQSSGQQLPEMVQSGVWVGEMAFMDYYWDQEQRRINKNAPQVYGGRASIYTIMATEDSQILKWSHEEMSELMSTSHDLRSALTRAMTSALVSKVIKMTVSKTKQMPTWSTWLSDWAHNAGAAVTVNTLAELPALPTSIKGSGKRIKTTGVAGDDSTSDEPSSNGDASLAL